ncbi:MAG: hypothetical protein ACI9DM_001444 [Cyclobacteriaceae bacterium]
MKESRGFVRLVRLTDYSFLNSSTILSPVLGYKPVQLFKRLGTVLSFVRTCHKENTEGFVNG